MRVLALPLTLLFIFLTPTLTDAAHGVALIVINQDAAEEKAQAEAGVLSLARVLELRGVATIVMTNPDRQQFESSLQQFVQATPVNGIALVYFLGSVPSKDGERSRNRAQIPLGLEARHVFDTEGGPGVLKLLSERSGAVFSVVVVEDAQERSHEHDQRRASGSDFGDDRGVFCFAQRGFATALAENLAEHTAALAPAIRAAATITESWTTVTPTMTAPPLNSRLRSSAEIVDGKAAGDEWVNRIGTVFNWCPPGTFMMTTSEDEGVARSTEVQIKQGYWLAKYELTKRELDLITPKRPRTGIAQENNHPRDALRYDEVLQFVRELNRRERFFGRLPDDWEYALPTEAQWEHACRAGKDTSFSFGNDLADLPGYANFADRQLFATGDDYYHYADRFLDDGSVYLAPVGTYRANPWGFHDMHGNLWEWTAAQPSHDSEPIARGGSWISLPGYCRSGFQRRFPRDAEQSFIGFRVALQRRPVP